ncbi:type II secretion system protein, partial [Armatimonas sp.]|uniref:type II secretion system protein n=1 Tax=Armatimonas sp. TaxID=1872638 RepID=UPI003752CCEE
MKSLRRAFTLVEIMIVVLIIGILVAIAVPNFIRARESARARACVGNLRQIDSAKEQYAMDNRLAQGASVAGGTLATLCGTGTTTYIKGSVP